MIRISFALVLAMVGFNTASASPLVKDTYWYEVQALTKRNHVPLTEYSEARAHLMQEVHLQRDHQGYFVEDVYCGIIYRAKVSPRTMPNHNELNVEHTWPQSRFNKRANTAFQKSDLHHLYPADSKANGKRGNVHFGDFKNGHSAFPYCTASKVGLISETGQEGFEPPDKHKGNVARSLFYFSIRYDIRIGEYEEFMLRQWNLMDPVDESEMARNDVIEGIQGNRNPFVDDSQLSDLITDF